MGFFRDKESFTFLDRLHDQLGQLSLPEALRDALVRLWWLRRQLPRKSAETAVGGYGHWIELVQRVLCEKLDPNWRESYRQVATVLRQTVRASSAVECMNSVLRMHQSRHRTLTQGMLDLKRLYWNTRVFRGGKRKGLCPYRAPGPQTAELRLLDLLEEEMATAFTEGEGCRPKRKKCASPLDVTSVKLELSGLGRSLPNLRVHIGTWDCVRRCGLTARSSRRVVLCVPVCRCQASASSRSRIAGR